jgi:uncharacterized damage-inducible protein DinB
MNELTALIDELKAIHDGPAWHGPALKELLAGVSATQAAAHPIPAAHSIWELVLHIEAWEQVSCQRLQGQSLEEPEAGDFPAISVTDEAAWQAAQEAFDRTHAAFLALLSTFSETDLERKVAGQRYSARLLLRGTVRHHVYHAGQIAILKRSLV